jgi:hypothetical protein
MNSDLLRASQSVSNFLEDELSVLSGFGSGARAHLNKFRSFLHQYHVDKFGSWPLLEGSQFPSSLYASMCLDFQGLYDYLVDYDSINSMDSEKVPSCYSNSVLQSIEIFNLQHGYLPLPHPLPLLPNAVSYKKARCERLSSIFNLKSSKDHVTGGSHSARSALCTAANARDLHVAPCSLVKAYKAFERDSAVPRDGLSLQDARKVRWILIYSVLQVLISATRVPKEVHHTDETKYPLCVNIHCLLPWNDRSHAKPAHSISDCARSISKSAIDHKPVTYPGWDHLNGVVIPYVDKPLPTTPDSEIHQDTSRINSPQSFDSLANYAEMVSAITAQTQTPLPIRQSSLNHPTKSISSGNPGSQRKRIVGKASRSSFCEIIVHGYGNGLNVMDEDISTTSSDTPRSSFSSNSTTVHSFSDDSMSDYSISDFRTSNDSFTYDSSCNAIPPGLVTYKNFGVKQRGWK